MVISSINVDLTRLTPAPIAYAKQGDANTRYIAVSLYDDGEPYVIPSGMAAAFRLAKPDGTYCFYDNENGETAVTTSGNVATILLAEQALTAAGTGYAEVNLYDANGKLTSFTFILDIQASVLPDDAISTNYVSFLTEIAQQILRAGIGLRPLGFYDTVSDLEAAITAPAPGDVYAVGDGAPYYYYAWDATTSAWVNMGEIKSKGLVILGNYATVSALEAAVTNPERGDAYGVGSAAPYDVYIWNGSEWVNWGVIEGAKGDTGATGATGATYTPNVSVDGVLSWTNNGNLPNPTPVDLSAPVNAFNVTLAAASWSNSNYVINNASITADELVIVDLPVSITAEQVEAAIAAIIRPTAQSAGSVTLTAFGDVPTVDIPVSIWLLGE